MFAFFTWVFFIVLITVVCWRVHLYRKNHFKGKELGKFVGKSILWFLLALIVCSIALISTAPDVDNSANSAKTKTHKVKKSKKKTNTENANKKEAKQTEEAKKKSQEKKKTKKKKGFSNSDKEAAALGMLKQNFKGKAKVWYDAENKAFMIQPTGDEFKEELLDIVATQDTDDWEILTDSMDRLSRSLYKNLGLADFVSIVNPDNPDKVLYSSLNGESKYDFLND